MSTLGESSIFQSSLPVETNLDRPKIELLDLSAQNYLLNIPRFSKSAGSIEIVDEKSSVLFRLLVRDGNALTFAPGRENRSPIELAQPDEPDEIDDMTLIREWRG
jgi:hypothetical protein